MMGGMLQFLICKDIDFYQKKIILHHNINQKYKVQFKGPIS